MGLTAILARVARPTTMHVPPARTDRAATAASTPVEIRIAPAAIAAARAPEAGAVTEAEGRIDPGPLVGSLARDNVAEALAGLPVAGTSGMAMKRADDFTGAFLAPMGFSGTGPKTGLFLDPTGSGAGTPGKARFMGVEATGRRFLIIADHSGSMAGPRFDRLRVEIVKTIKGLKPGARFYVIFYSDTVLLYPERRWLAGRRDAMNFFGWLEGLGIADGTNPLPAFQAAFSQLRPRPDAIFFMTDGEFSPQVADEIPTLNVGPKPVPIHSISLEDRRAEAVLRKIATDSGGTYRHVDLNTP